MVPFFGRAGGSQAADKSEPVRPLTTNDIESELSYAYLHAVASSVGAGMGPATRHEDNAGVDAKLVGWGPFVGGGFLTEVDLKVQLKATTKNPRVQDGKLSFELQGIHRYDDLRAETVSTPRILVVLFLPEDQEEWLEFSTDSLTLRKCAYWVSLRGADSTTNRTSVTVYLPESQPFNPDGLREVFRRLSLKEVLRYSEVGE